MTGRGVDQILPWPSSPELREPYVHDAREYVKLAESINGPISRPVEPAYVWGDALALLDELAPDARIVNLETSVTVSDEFSPEKDIHYRMHPRNVDCLTAARLDVCVLANNHVLDFGRPGLAETIEVLVGAGIRVSGAGASAAQAQHPAVVPLRQGRVLVFAVGSETSGIPSSWAAGLDRPGIDLLPDLSDATADALVSRVARYKRPGDVAVVSIHWGSNWGYEVPLSHVRFAHRLLDGPIDLVHGHSSHHPRPIEFYAGKLVLYGCGDFITDYEGIGGYEQFRDDLVVMYFPVIDAEMGRLQELRLAPLQIRRMQLVQPSPRDRTWLRARLCDISQPFGCEIVETGDGMWRASLLSR
jgi:poly-gamma-glutamate synthesis protein (capsule biosynthesis protein)